MFFERVRAIFRVFIFRERPTNQSVFRMMKKVERYGWVILREEKRKIVGGRTYIIKKKVILNGMNLKIAD